MGASELWAGKSLLLPAKPVHLCSIPGICTVKEQNWLPQVVLWPAHAHKQTDRQTENHKDTKKHTQDQWNVEKIIINTCSEQGSENQKGPEKSLTALPGFDPYMSPSCQLSHLFTPAPRWTTLFWPPWALSTQVQMPPKHPYTYKKQEIDFKKKKKFQHQEKCFKKILFFTYLILKCIKYKRKYEKMDCLPLLAVVLPNSTCRRAT